MWFGYERYDNPVVVPLINALCKGALTWLLNGLSRGLSRCRIASKYRVNVTSQILLKTGIEKSAKFRELQPALADLPDFTISVNGED